MLGQIISSPTPTRQPNIAACRAAVPLLWPSAYFEPCQAAYSCSNCLVTSVPDIAPRRSTSSTASSSSWVTIGQVKRSPGGVCTALGPPSAARRDVVIIGCSLLPGGPAAADAGRGGAGDGPGARVRV